MPNVVEIAVNNADFQPPQLRNFESSIAGNSEAVEFIVKTDAPIPICGRAPVLYVGAMRLGEVSEIGPNTYRFVATAPERLVEDAPIQLGWTGENPASAEANAAYRYKK